MWSFKFFLLLAAHLLVQLGFAKTDGVLLIAEFPTTNPKDRADLVNRLEDISKITSKNDNIYKYSILTPKADDGKTLFTIEEYADQAAFDAHLASKPVQDLFGYLEAVKVTPIVNTPTVVDGLQVSKPIPAADNPWILVQTITYKDDAALPRLLPAWRDVVSAAKKESGTLLFGVYADPKDPRKLFTVEAYQSFDYFTGTHARGDALAVKNNQTSDSVASLSGAELAHIRGFLYKG